MGKDVKLKPEIIFAEPFWTACVFGFAYDDEYYQVFIGCVSLRWKRE